MVSRLQFMVYRPLMTDGRMNGQLKLSNKVPLVLCRYETLKTK